MSIQSKLIWTFLILLIFGITAVSSYSILFIRNFLINEGVVEIEKDARWMAATLRNIDQEEGFEAQIEDILDASQYQMALYDEHARLLGTFPDSISRRTPEMIPGLVLGALSEGTAYVVNNRDSTRLIAYAEMPFSINEARFVQISQFKDRFYEPIKTIRWIIYTGMFISIALVIIVSIGFGRYISRPILQLEETARAIADGDVDREIHLNRGDEFGTLAESLNEMASRLRADTEQLKEVNERQRQFFADITHEIRNPLHTISGSLEMLELEELPEEKREKYLNNAKKQTERISRLYKDLVTLQRYDSDDYFIEVKQFDLGEISKHLYDLYHEQAEEKGLELTFDTHSCRASGDPGKIEQVLENLVSNAIKYTGEGEIRLSYKQKADRVKVVVEDTGIGIGQEHLERLFDRFYRTDKARSRDKGGTGLGLSVVKSILSAHGSEIEVESTPHRGTRFQFELER